MKSFFSRLGLFSLAGAIMLSATVGCERRGGPGGAGGDSGSGDILVGGYGSITGGQAAFGTSERMGFELAVEQLNAKGGVLGRKVRMQFEDSASKPEEASTVVTKLVKQDRVVAVLGEVASSNSLAAATICPPSKIPMISPASTNAKLTQQGDYIFRV